MKDSYGRDWLPNEDGWFSPVPERTPESDVAAIAAQAAWEARRAAAGLPGVQVEAGLGEDGRFER